MKPIEQMSLQECLEALMKPTLGDFLTFNHVDRIALAARIHDLTRWIPVEERLPTEEDAYKGKVYWKNEDGYIETMHYGFAGELYGFVSWRRIDKPEGV